MTYDAAIVGAGPCGATAAFLLSRAGLKVLVLEKEAFPRAKPCGGGLTARARSLLPFDVSDCIEGECRAVDLHFPGIGASFRVEREKPLFFMVRRERFDHACARQAEQAGAAVLFQAPLTGLTLADSGAVLMSGSRTFHASLVIGADGAHGITADAAGFRDERLLAYAVLRRGGIPSRGMPRFDFPVSLPGYTWAFPGKDSASSGAVCVFGASVRGFRIPVSPRKEAVMRDRVFLAGDALGCADPVTAEGLSNAVLSARLCAEALCTAGGRARTAARRYRTALEKEIFRELRAGRRLSRLMYRAPRLRDFLFKRHGQALAEAAADVFSGKRRYSEELKKGVNYLKLLKLFR